MERDPEFERRLVEAYRKRPGIEGGTPPPLTWREWAEFWLWIGAAAAVVGIVMAFVARGLISAVSGISLAGP